MGEKGIDLTAVTTLGALESLAHRPTDEQAFALCSSLDQHIGLLRVSSNNGGFGVVRRWVEAGGEWERGGEGSCAINNTSGKVESFSCDLCLVGRFPILSTCTEVLGL